MSSALRVWAAWSLGLLAIVGCARPGSPMGGEVPDIPPLVVATQPDTFAVVESFRSAVRFEFDVPMSERPTAGQLRDAVVVSPRTGSVSVRHRGERVEVSMEGGFRSGQIYRITLLPVLQDRFQNRMIEPVELFFSTGPEFEPNLVAGFLVDRLTRQEAEGARLDAIPSEDGPVHSTVADSTGVFAFPYLPSGEYRLVAYEDRNRNREADFEEPQDSTLVRVVPGDTVVLTDLALLLPDTTAATLVGAEVRDSVHLALEFDDHIDPEWDPDDVRVELTREDGAAPRAVEILHEHEWDALERERRARVAEEAPPPEPEDPEAPPEEPAPPPPEAEPPPEEEEERPILPSQVLVVRLSEALEPGTEYSVHVEGVENINGIPGGEGTLDFSVPEPPPEPEPGSDPEADPDPNADPDPDPSADPDRDPPPPPPPDTGRVTGLETSAPSVDLP